MAKKTQKLKLLGKKGKNTAGKTLKQKKRINKFRALSHTQKQRELALRRLRGLKETGRNLENANTSNNNGNNGNNGNNAVSLTESQLLEKEEREFEELERQEELKKYNEAKAIYDKIKPDTFLYRVNKINPPGTKASDLIGRFPTYFHSNSFELFYKGKYDIFSFYYFFEEQDYDDNVQENNGFNFDVEPAHYMVVYALDPVLFFKEIIAPKYFGWGGHEVDFYKSPPGFSIITLYDYHDMKDFVMRIPGFREKVRREQEAVFTGPPKLERLQLRGLEETTRQFEERTGREVPRNVANTMERYLRRYYPTQPRYLQNRNNLSRINTTLFQ